MSKTAVNAVTGTGVLCDAGFETGFVPVAGFALVAVLLGATVLFAGAFVAFIGFALASDNFTFCCAVFFRTDELVASVCVALAFAMIALVFGPIVWVFSGAPFFGATGVDVELVFATVAFVRFSGAVFFGATGLVVESGFASVAIVG
jgi:hypothetical protein